MSADTSKRVKRLILLGTSIINCGSSVQEFKIMGSSIEDIVLDACFAIFYERILHYVLFYIKVYYYLSTPISCCIIFGNEKVRQLNREPISIMIKSIK